MEAIALDIIALRLGYLHDEAGQRMELHWGAGARLFKHIAMDYYMISTPAFMKGTDARNTQWGFTLTAYQIINWFRK